MLPARLAGLLCCCGAAATGFELPAIPAPLRPLLDARIYNAAPIISSLPAHPLGPRFLDEFIAFLLDGMAQQEINALTVHRLVCAAYGDSDLGIYAVDQYAARHGTQDGFLAWLAESSGGLRAACRAQDWLARAGALYSPPAEGRGAVFARLRAAEARPSAQRAAADTLRAWAEAVDPAQARYAGRQARALIANAPLRPLLPVLAYDPAPPALLRELAGALDDPATLDWLMDLPVRGQHAAPPPSGLAPHARAAALVTQYVAGGPVLADFDRVASALPEDTRAYLALPVAQRLVQQFDLDAAETRLEEAARLDTAGAWLGPISAMRQRCRAGAVP